MDGHTSLNSQREDRTPPIGRLTATLYNPCVLLPCVLFGCGPESQVPTDHELGSELLAWRVVTEPSTTHAPLLDAYATLRCEVRLQHSLDLSLRGIDRREPTSSEQRRIDAGRSHERAVLEKLEALCGDQLLVIEQWSRDVAQEATKTALNAKAPLIAGSWLPSDFDGRRSGRPDLLVRVADGYLPIEIKLHLLTTEGNGRLESSPLHNPRPEAASGVDGRRFRKGTGWFDDALQLAHYYRMLEALGCAGQVDGLLGGVIDGSGTLWWIDLDMTGGSQRRTPLQEYDRRFIERLLVADHTVARNDDPTLPRAVTPWFHKECETCQFNEICEAELAATDDISLVRWVSRDTLATLRSAGVTTRNALAALDRRLIDLGEQLSTVALSLPQVIDLAREHDAETPLADVVGRRMGVRRYLVQAGFDTAGDLLACDETSLLLAGRIRDLGRLLRRARATVGGGVLLQVPGDELDAGRADIEVDVDMESYEHATYLWGAYVSSPSPGILSKLGVEEGYHSFVSFDALDDATEVEIFGAFWKWLSDVRAQAAAAGLQFRAYCFWRAAEEGQMKRAVSLGGGGLPSIKELEHFFRSEEWVDLHQLAKDQLLTEGPLGLKVLAGFAGFSWRDEDPSGEASIGWYEEARSQDATSALAAQARLLAYNEDDVRATRALRNWLDGPARTLPHLDDVPHRAR